MTCFSLPFHQFLQPLLAPVLSALLLAGLPVVIDTNDGQQLEGELDGFGESSLRFSMGQTTSDIPFDQLMSLRPVDVDSRTGPTFVVTLLGGSRIAAQDLSTTENDLVIQPRRQNAVTVPLKQVKAIRFRAASTTTDPSWLGLLEKEQRGDTLVIRRAGDRLDPQQGLINAVKTDAVQFDLDGTVVNAPVERLEGVIFGGTGRVATNTNIQITDVYGSTWAVIGIAPSQGDLPLRIKLSGDVEHEIPLNQIKSIRWSGGVQMLASAEPATSTFQPYLSTSVDPKLQSAFFGAAVDSDSDLIMHGGSTIEFRVDPGFQTLTGAVGRRAGINKASSVTVRILMDGKMVWEQTLTDAELRGFELPLDGARRVSLQVANDDDGELGDTVRMVRPRLVK